MSYDKREKVDTTGEASTEAREDEAKSFKDAAFEKAVNSFGSNEAKDAKAFIVKRAKEIEDDYIAFESKKKEIDEKISSFDETLKSIKKSQKDPETEKKITSLEKRIIILEESSKKTDEKVKALDDLIKTIMASPVFDELKEPSQFDKIYPEPEPAAKSEKVQTFWVSYVANSPYFGKDEQMAIKKANNEEPGVAHIANEEYWWINKDGTRMRRATGEELDKLEELGLL